MVWVPILLISFVLCLLLWPKIEQRLIAAKFNKKIPLSDPWFIFWGLFSSFDRLALTLKLWKDKGRLYVFHPFPMLYSVETSNPALVKTICLNITKFPKSAWFFAKGTIADRTLGQSLIAADGQVWRNQRRSLDPAFKKSFLIGMVPQFQELAMKIVRDWKQVEANKPVIANDFFTKLTLDAIGIAGFGYDFGALDNKISQEITALNDTLRGYLDPIQFIPIAHKLPNSMKTKAHKGADVIFDLLDKTVTNAHKNPNHPPKTILEHLLQISKTEHEEEGILSKEELQNNMFLFFFAGHETTASCLTSTLYFLSKFPQIQEQLQKEIDENLAGKPVDAENIEKLKFTENVLKESLRLRPPALINTFRQTTEPTEMDGVIVPPKTQLSINIPAILRDPQLWEEPERFWPERWEKPIPSEQNIPFFYGPRICIGKKFAMLEMVTVLATIYQYFDTELVPNYQLENSPNDIILKVKDGLPILVRKRKL